LNQPLSFNATAKKLLPAFAGKTNGKRLIGDGITWYKKGISVPLQFQVLDDSVMVMGYLFGRDAADYVIKTKKTEWLMSLGITMNTKEEIKKIIENYEKRN